MNIVEEYWSGAVQRLQVEVDVFNKLIGHAGEQGRENELALTRVLQNLIPRRLGLGSGIIIDRDNQRSKQTNIVIYDSVDQPSIMAQSSQVIYPIEVIHAAVEVKTTLTEGELTDCGKKFASLRLLRSAHGRTPAFIVLAYAAWASPKTVAKHIAALGDQRPDLLCVLDPGLIYGTAPSQPPGGSETVNLVALHERDSYGARIPTKWVQPEESHTLDTLIKYGSSYPITLLTGRQRIVGEPGRALLLFLDGLLRLLHAQQAIPEPSLSYYLTDTARETIALDTT